MERSRSFFLSLFQALQKGGQKGDNGQTAFQIRKNHVGGEELHLRRADVKGGRESETESVCVCAPVRLLPCE